MDRRWVVPILAGGWIVLAAAHGPVLGTLIWLGAVGLGWVLHRARPPE
jgi:hypothetical protein